MLTPLHFESPATEVAGWELQSPPVRGRLRLHRSRAAVGGTMDSPDEVWPVASATGQANVERGQGGLRAPTRACYDKAMNSQIEHLAQMLREAQYAVALTGAGVSTDSGIPDFRSPTTGLWAQYNPMEVASIGGFRSNPARFYEFWRVRFAKLADAQPNITHIVLAQLEAHGSLKCVITQNIDNLHRKAGSKRVLEVHGNYTRGLCIGCKRTYTIQEIFAKVERHRIPLCDACNSLLKPDAVLFGELLTPDFDQALDEIARCDLVLVLGTSLEVYPVAGLVPQAKQHGARIALINRDRTPFDPIADLVIHGELQPAMTELQRIFF